MGPERSGRRSDGHVLQDMRGVRFRRLPVPVPVVTHTSGT